MPTQALQWLSAGVLLSCLSAHTLATEIYTDALGERLPYMVVVPEYEILGEPLANAEFTSSDENFAMIHGDQVTIEASHMLAEHRRRHLREARLKAKRNHHRRQFLYSWARAVRPNRDAAPLPKEQLARSTVYASLRQHTRSLITDTSESIIRQLRENPADLTDAQVALLLEELAVATSLHGQPWAPLVTGSVATEPRPLKALDGDKELLEFMLGFAGKTAPISKGRTANWILFFDEDDGFESLVSGRPLITSAPVQDSLDQKRADLNVGTDDPLAFRRDPDGIVWVRNWRLGLVTPIDPIPRPEKVPLTSMAPPTLRAIANPDFLKMGSDLQSQLMQLRGPLWATSRQLVREVRRQRQSLLNSDEPTIDVIYEAADYLYCRQIMLREFLADTTVMQATIERLGRDYRRTNMWRKNRVYQLLAGALENEGFAGDTFSWETLQKTMPKGPGPVSIVAIPPGVELTGENKVTFDTWVQYRAKGDPKKRRYRAKSGVVFVNIYSSSTD